MPELCVCLCDIYDIIMMNVYFAGKKKTLV